ncbi:hypothetical protein [Actinomadura madurae]|uniref:hypothetical protein n=1 Tax=Actinomadura madurae TaxID=1993 RepID=UPI0020D23F4E|nr:hypothetical protein [Actinomadura madurae]MCP9980372.1 hypothetical protein [Actinomadura madurae]MCQ0008111.1 hypothetical protein [Actinomadura madurae]
MKGTAVALSPDGRTVVTRETRDPDQGEGFDVYLWDAQTGRQRGGRIPCPAVARWDRSARTGGSW